ncbi:MarR family transcriptional regulator [Streptomyces sp. CAU 1734]|uniref:MarR family winged helix-turn-helix transcriptional regulator n=1 Tax=Streptomyces sp. CAU 1734 TaxID=3140360 RepID=UPI00326175A3
MTTTEPAAPAGGPGEQPPDAVDAIVGQWAEVRPDLDTGPMAVYGRIHRISRAMSDLMEREYKRYGLNLGEFDVLATLRRSGEPYTLSPRQLSATLMLTTGGMTGRLDRLEKAGMLTRNPDPLDRRGLRVTLTERGLAVADEAVAAGVSVQRELFGTALDEAEARRLGDLLRRLLSVHPS